MSKILSWTLAIGLILAVIACIPYGIWVVYTLFKRRWKRAAIAIAILAAALLCLWGIGTLQHRKARSEYLAGLYDTKTTLGPALFEYNSDRSFNGDGFSLSVYALPATVRRRFETADEELLSRFPKLPDFRNRWKAEPWREAPLEPRFQWDLDFALCDYDAKRAPGLPAQFTAVRKAMARKGTYYAFFYYDPSGHLGDIDFLVVDLVESRLYLINLDT